MNKEEILPKVEWHNLNTIMADGGVTHIIVKAEIKAEVMNMLDKALTHHTAELKKMIEETIAYQISDDKERKAFLERLDDITELNHQ